MRILILSFYYPPDLGPGALRAASIAKAMECRLGSGDSVHVLTTGPNRYGSFDVEAPSHEENGKVKIERIALPRHQNGFRDQALSFFRFASEVRRRTRGMQADVVLATSSRLMTATLGALVARRLGARLYLDIRDLFTENLRHILKGASRPLLRAPLLLMERWTLRQAYKINVVSPGFVTHVRRIRPDVTPSVYTNGIDREFLRFDYHREANTVPVILYAGNIGDGQGLERVVPEAARRLAGRYRFRIIGDGGRRQELERRLNELGQKNGSTLPVEILPPVDRAKLMEHYAQADILFLHLSDFEAFRLVIPSKLFEYGATGKPILAGISGIARDFAAEWLENVAIFAPCDPAGLTEALETLHLGLSEREKFNTNFERTAIMDELARDVRSC